MKFYDRPLCLANMGDSKAGIKYNSIDTGDQRLALRMSTSMEADRISQLMKLATRTDLWTMTSNLGTWQSYQPPVIACCRLASNDMTLVYVVASLGRSLSRKMG